MKMGLVGARARYQKKKKFEEKKRDKYLLKGGGGVWKVRRGSKN